jgi:hypothetical protein
MDLTQYYGTKYELVPSDKFDGFDLIFGGEWIGTVRPRPSNGWLATSLPKHGPVKSGGWQSDQHTAVVKLIERCRQAPDHYLK